MIFLGDIACPDERVDAFNEAIANSKCFDNEVVILNLEATFAESGQGFADETLFNSKKVLDAFLHKGKKVIVSLANNHMYDYPNRIVPTMKYLSNKGVGMFGICETDGQVKPYVYEDELGNKHAFFGHCWRLYTQTNVNRVNNVRVVDHAYSDFINIVSQYIKCNPETKVYCFMHWNYDLEKLPFPQHLNVARKLIDNGASCVIGSHSHRPQAAEMYKGKPIAYGLGNFYLLSNMYFSGKLGYPACSKETYALLISEGKAKIQWFRTDDPQQKFVVVENGIEAFKGKRIAGISNMLELPMSQYVSYFRKNRLKRTFVPVFIEYSGFMNRMKESFAILRVKIIRKLKQ